MIVGLTGGIGSGKSTVASFFKELGVPVYIADTKAKLLMEQSEEVRKRIVDTFGDLSYTEKGPNRPYLADIVFKNPEQLKKLNAIIHPAVREDFDQWYNLQQAPYIIKEVAILFESGGDALCDRIITVVAPMEVRMQRVLQRDQTTAEQVRDRMRNQWTDAARIERSDYVIENIDLTATRMRVEAIHQHILKKKN